MVSPKPFYRTFALHGLFFLCQSNLIHADDPDGKGRIIVTESYEYESDTQIKRIKTHHAIPGEELEIEGQLNMRIYFPQELDALIKYNGLVIENKYGSDDQAVFDKESEKQLIVCRLPEGS